MNQEQALAAVRWLGTVLGAFAVGRGWVTKDQVTALLTDVPTLIGAAVPVATLVWSIISRTDAAKLKAVTSMPEVKQVVVAPTAPDTAAAQAAASISEPKVTAR